MQPSEQVLVMILSIDAVTIEPPQLYGDEFLIFLTEHEGAKLCIGATSLVERLGNNHPFEGCAQALAYFFVALKASPGIFRKDQ
jgi:hypothetical protein